MRSLKKNKNTLYYALYNGKEEVVDENGDFTGEYIIGYSAPVVFYANISAGKGSAQADIFGVNVDFTRTISTTDLSLPITETSLVWYETKPKILEDGRADPESADYKVAAPPAVGLNELIIALKARAKNV